MADGQDIGNRHGAAIREAETALAANDLYAARAAMAKVHATAAEIYLFVTVDLAHPIDWDGVAGNGEANRGAQALGGGSKDAPSR